MEDQLFDLLSAIIFNQLALEKNEKLIGSSYYKGQLKPKIKAVTSYLDPIQKKEYNELFKQNPEMVLSCVFHIEKVVDFLKDYRIDELVMLASMMEARNKNPKAMEGIMNKILNK